MSERSCESALGGTAATLAAETVGPPLVCDSAFLLLDELADGAAEAGAPAAEPVEAGPACAGVLGCGELAGGFGARNFTHRTITAIESSDAIRIRISPDNSFFFCGSLTNAPLSVSRSCWRERPPQCSDARRWFRLCRERGRIRTSAKADGSARAVSIPAKSRAARQTAQSLRTHISNTSARSGSSPQTTATHTPYKYAAPRARLSRSTSAPPVWCLARCLHPQSFAHCPFALTPSAAATGLLSTPQNPLAPRCSLDESPRPIRSRFPRDGRAPSRAAAAGCGCAPLRRQAPS